MYSFYMFLFFYFYFLLEMDSFPPGSPPSSPTNSISLATLVSGHTPQTGASSFSTPGPSSRVSPPSHPTAQTGRSQLNAASDVAEGTATSGASSPAGRHALSVLSFLHLSGKAFKHLKLYLIMIKPSTDTKFNLSSF